MAVQSFKVWLVLESGYEHTDPHGAFTLRREAQKRADKLQRAHNAEPPQDFGGIVHKEPLRFYIKQIDLVSHDGANHLNQHLLYAVGKNK